MAQFYLYAAPNAAAKIGRARSPPGNVVGADIKPNQYRQNQTAMNGIIIDGKVYEVVPSAGYCNCDGCDLTDMCDAHAHDICNDCDKMFDTYIDDPRWHFRYSNSLTDKIKKL